MSLYSVFKNIAFKFDPEKIHDLTISSAHIAPKFADLFTRIKSDDRFALDSPCMQWKFPVGVAAGFDKNAKAISFFEKLGFGALEVGTITKQPQIGNPKPRVFRHAKINSLQNGMGFPNAGSDEILKNIKQSEHSHLILGSNIGKNKNTTEANTPEEYAYLYKMFAPVSNYIVVNISSPNTPGLRSFQKKEMLAPILQAINEEKKLIHRPIFIKIAPDLSEDEVVMLCELSKEYEFNGIIATNTTIQHEFGAGGLSGDFIKPYSQKVRSLVCQNLKEDSSQVIIGVGGISTYDEVKEFWKQGGHFVQVYTSFIYHGPQLLADIKNGIRSDLIKYGFKNLNEFHQNIHQI